MDGRSKAAFFVALMLFRGMPLEDLLDEVLIRLGGTHMRQVIGDDAQADLFQTGIPGALGVDMSGSLSLNMPPMMDMVLSSIGITSMNKGPVQQVFGSLFNAATGEGDWIKALPLEIQQIHKSWKEYDEGVTTGSGRPVTIDGQRIKRTAGEAAVGVLGINPTRIGRLKERKYKDLRVATEYQKRKSDIVDDFIAANTVKDRHEVTKRIIALNKEIREKKGKFGDSFNVAPITSATIKARKKEYKMSSYKGSK